MGCGNSREAAGMLHSEARLYHQTTLTSMNIFSVASANRVVGEARDSTIMVLCPRRSMLKPYITIPDGFMGLVQRWGADVNYPGTGKAVWPPGFHRAAPYMRVSHLVTKQAIAFSSPVKGVKTKDDVHCEINLTLVIRVMGDEARGEDPDLVRQFVWRLRPSGLQQQLKAAQEEAVRALARSVNHDEVYGLRGGGGAVRRALSQEHGGEAKQPDGDTELQEMGSQREAPHADFERSRHTEELRRVLNDQFHSYGIDIAAVAITRVKLPDQFVQQMQDKTTYASVIENQHMRQRNDMAKIDQDNVIAALQQAKNEERDIALARGEKLCAEEEKELQGVLAETKQAISSIGERRADTIRQLNAAADLRVAELAAQARLTHERVMAEAKAEQSKLEADTEAYCREQAAAAAARVAELEAAASKLVAEAEGRAAPMLTSKRSHEERVQALDVLRALSKNPHVALSGAGAGNLMSDLLVSQQGSQVLVTPPPAPDAGGRPAPDAGGRPAPDAAGRRVAFASSS